LTGSWNGWIFRVGPLKNGLRQDRKPIWLRRSLERNGRNEDHRLIALAAIQSGQPLETFSFKRSCELVKAFLLTHLSQLFRQTSTALVTFFHQLVQAVVLMGHRDRCRSPA